MTFKIVCLLLTCATVISEARSTVAKYDASIEKTLEQKLVTDVLLHFHGSKVSSIIETYKKSHSIQQRSKDFDTLPNLLMSHAAESQSRVLELLQNAQKTSASLKYFQIWAINLIAVKNMDAHLFRQLLISNEISYIEEDRYYKNEVEAEAKNATVTKGIHANAWGIDDIEAPAVWASGNQGSGVVVGIIDTGARRSHETLRDGWRQSYGWFDALNGENLPYDDNSHGTHCIGSAVGKLGIGVAPEAEWIACKALNSGNGFNGADVLKCGQWMFCPTDPSGNNQDCSKRPKIVTCSWAYYENNSGYNQILQLWDSVNMISVFANGNSGGDGCSSVTSPADSSLAIGAGSTTSENRLSSFSSRGPTSNGITKPDVSAPGEAVYSASSGGDTEYSIKSGTSMATPHVAGLAALIASVNPDITQEQVRSALSRGVKPIISTDETCGGINDSVYPNNHVGYGKINAPLAVSAAAVLY